MPPHGSLNLHQPEDHQVTDGLMIIQNRQIFPHLQGLVLLRHQVPCESKIEIWGGVYLCRNPADDQRVTGGLIISGYRLLLYKTCPHL
jgi:hypothetical protein